MNAASEDGDGVGVGRLKKAMYLLAGVLLVAVAAFVLYLRWEDATVIDRSLRAYAGIETYDVLDKAQSKADWFARVRIHESDGSRLLRRYPFKLGFRHEILAGKYDGSHLSDCPTCWSYLDKSGGPYGYRLFVLSGDERELVVYQVFAD